MPTDKPAVKRTAVCLSRSCTRAREPWQLLCTTCWKALPDDLRATFWSTKPHTSARLVMCRRVLEYVKENAGQEELL